MKRITILLTILLSLFLISCENKKYDIVTTNFIEYDIVKAITKDKLNTYNLTKPGVDSHDYEPTSKEIKLIKNSNLFIFQSYKLDTFLNNNVSNLLGENTKYIKLNDYNDVNIDDLHFFTDPLLFLKFINVIKDEIIKLDKNNKNYYINNANEYYNKILNLHNDFLDFLKNIKNIKIYFSGHNSMLYFTKRYNIEIISINDTNKPDADLTSYQIVSLIKKLKENNVKYLFYPELSNKSLVNTIKNELKSIDLLLLHSYHNVSKNEYNNNKTYYDLFKNNITNIKKAVANEYN